MQLPPADAEPSRPSFVASVNVVLVTYVIDAALAFVAGVVVARALGPDGRGAYSLFVLSATFAQVMLGLGTGAAATYYLNRGTLQLRPVLGALHVVVLASLVVVAAGVAAVAPWAGDPLGAGVSLWLFVAAVPVLLYATLLRFVLQALGRFADQGVATIVQTAALLALLAPAAGVLSPAGAVALWTLSNAVAAAYAVQRLGVRNVDLRQITRPRWATLSPLVRFGVQGEAGTVLQLLNYRLDAYLVRGFVGLAGVGIYSVGVSLTEAIWLAPNAVAVVLMPRLASMDADEARETAPVVARNTLLIAALAAAALAAAAPLIVPLFFGERFEDAVQALWWLLPGAVALSGSKVLTSYIFSQGRPAVNTLITALSLAVTLAADFALIPVFGVNGAAAASSLAYCGHFGAALCAYRLIARRPVLDALLPRSSDARLYADAARSLYGRLLRRTAPAARPTAGPLG